MNEFEIKSALIGLKDIGVIDIRKVSEEYNLKEYGNVEVDLVIQYEYKNDIYFTHILFESFARTYGVDAKDKETKIEQVRGRIKTHIKEVQKHVYCSTSMSYSASLLEQFINTQIDLRYAQAEKAQPTKDFSDIDLIWEVIRKGRGKELTNVKLYKESMKIADKEWK